MQEANSTYDWPTGIAEILFVASIIWAVSIVEMLACDRSLTHNRQHNSVVSRMPQAIIADKLNRHQLVLTNVSATAHVFSKAVSDPNPGISATGTALRGIKEATSGTGYKVTQSEHYLERFHRLSRVCNLRLDKLSDSEQVVVGRPSYRNESGGLRQKQIDESE